MLYSAFIRPCPVPSFGQCIVTDGPIGRSPAESADNPQMTFKVRLEEFVLLSLKVRRLRRTW